MVQVLVQATHEFMLRKMGEIAVERRREWAAAFKFGAAAAGFVVAGTGAIALAVWLLPIVQALALSAVAVVGAWYGTNLCFGRAKGHFEEAGRMSKKRGHYKQGMDGEIDVAQKFEMLPDSFAVIHDFHLGEGRSNVDHILFGIKGVLALETKNMSGDYVIVRDHWTKNLPATAQYPNPRPYDMPKNPSRQARRNAEEIEAVLRQAGIRIPVTGAVVMADDSATFEQKDCLVPVLRLGSLFGSLSELPTDIKQFDVGRAAQALYERHQNVAIR